jgi:adenylate cyclase
MRALLTYQTAGTQHEKPLEEPFISIGRGEKNAVVLDDQRTSRNHALLRSTSTNKYYLMDTGSKNGTYLNGKRVIAPTLLRNGDRIKLGESLLTFSIEGAEKPTDTGTNTYDSRTTTAAGYDSIKVTQVTVLVADISEYATMSEQLPLNFLAKLLGEWFRSANDIVEKNGGFVDKFIGDAVMACWLIDEKDQDPKESIKQTLKAAYDLYKMTERTNDTNPLLPKPLKIGVGINTGEAVVSDLGSGHPEDDTVLGDSVNIAFRLEKTSKELKADIAISYDSYKYLGESFCKEREQTTMVKGKDEPVRVCALKFRELPELLL